MKHKIKFIIGSLAFLSLSCNPVAKNNYSESKKVEVAWQGKQDLGFSKLYEQAYLNLKTFLTKNDLKSKREPQRFKLPHLALE